MGEFVSAVGSKKIEGGKDMGCERLHMGKGQLADNYLMKFGDRFTRFFVFFCMMELGTYTSV